MKLRDRGKNRKVCMNVYYFVPFISYYSGHDMKGCHIGATCRLYWKNVKLVVLLQKFKGKKTIFRVTLNGNHDYR